MSKVLSFLGETPTIALRKAQQECGEDAVVISTKKISDKLKDGKDMYEILVAIEDEEDFTTSNLAQNAQNILKNYQKPTQTVQIPTKDNEIITAQLYDFKAEILKMQQEIKNIQKSLWEPKSYLFDLTIPSEFIDMYNLFEKNELDSEMTYTIMKKTIESLPLTLKKDEQKIKNFFKIILRRIVPIKYETLIRLHQRKVMMFIGPTGVGKTTSIAKLAARYAYKLGANYKVGIITLDSFRVGAIEQLKAYTNIMRLPLEVVKKPQDLVEALLRLKDCNYILIDTAGSSQYDIDKIELISEYQNRLKDITIEKHLVIPANIKASDLLEIYDKYSVLGINYLLVSKLDETKSFGNIISFAYKVKKSICYFSIGQNVPDDLIEANHEFLIEAFMNQKLPEVKND